MFIDFFENAPVLQNEFKVWLTSSFFEGSSVADAPDWLRTYDDKAGLARSLKEEYERVTSNTLLVLCRASNGGVDVHILKTGDELLSDETVESIGREDYVRMVACLGEPITDKYFSRDKRSGLR